MPRTRWLVATVMLTLLVLSTVPLASNPLASSRGARAPSSGERGATTAVSAPGALTPLGPAPAAPRSASPAATASGPVTGAPGPFGTITLVGFSSSRSLLVVGKSVTFTASAKTSSAGATEFTFTWNVGDGSAPFVTTANVSAAGTAGASSLSHTYVAVGTWNANVVVSDNRSDAPVTSRNLTVEVVPYLVVTASVTHAYVTLGGSTAVVANATGGAPPYTYRFLSVPGGCTALGGTLSCTPASINTFSVSVQALDSASNSNTTNASFTVNAPITLIAGAAGTFSCNGSAGLVTENFTANATGGTPPYSYDWVFGDGSASSNATFLTRTYTASGNLTATVSVNDSGQGHASKTFAVGLNFGACGGAAAPSFSAPLVLVEVIVVLALVVVGVLALAVWRNRHTPKPPRPPVGAATASPAAPSTPLGAAGAAPPAPSAPGNETARKPS